MLGIDLFAGAGGMSTGATMAGINVQIAVEQDLHAATTFATNHKRTSVFQGDIRSFSPDIDRSNSEQVALFGGPPCQGFSTSNQRTRSKENPTNWLFQEFLRVTRKVMPDWVVFENVRGIVETEKGYFIEEIIRSFQKLGYSTHHEILCSLDFGIPQKRSRFFLVCSLHNEDFTFPSPLTSPPVTVSQALHDLPILDNGESSTCLPYHCAPQSQYAQHMRGSLSESRNHLVTKNSKVIVERFKHVPQGGNWEDIPQSLMKNYKDVSRCHTGIYHRLEEDAPSVVIGNYRKNMLIHPTQHRGLSVREAARLQSFPDSFVFEGSIGFQQQQVGNAVPPLLSKAVFEQIVN